MPALKGYIREPPQPDKYANLNFTQFRSMFGKFADSKTLHNYYDEYKNNKSKLPESMGHIIKKIQEEEQAVLKAAGDALPYSSVEQNKHKILALSALSPSIPKGVLLSLDSITLSKNRQGDAVISSLPEEAFLDMIVNDCDFEIQRFLSDAHLFDNLGDVTKQFSPLGYRQGGYKESLTFLRNLFGIEEPETCSKYQFSTESLKENLKNMTNEEFDNYLRSMGFYSEFEQWWKSNRPANVAPGTEISFDEWYNIARKILGIDSDYKIVSMEERGKLKALENIKSAVEILMQKNPSYDPSQVDLEVIGIKDTTLPEISPISPKPEAAPPSKPASKTYDIDKIRKIRAALKELQGFDHSSASSK